MGPSSPFILANVNHSARAQDLLIHTLDEWQASIGVVVDPYRIPVDRNDWFGDAEGLVAIVARNRQGFPTCTASAAGRGAVLVRWGDTAVVGVYAPPRWPLEQFEEFLDRVGSIVSACPSRGVLILGDFNAHAVEWGSSTTDPRGEAVLVWAAAHGLLLQNRGSVSTCVRPQGESVVDLTWASPVAARLVASWRVEEGVETLSDHRYVRVDISSDTRRRGGGRSGPRRWALRALDRDLAEAAALAACWPASPDQTVADVQGEAEWLRDTLHDICNVSMPRAAPRPRRAAYWWTPHIAELRKACVPLRRRYQRARRRRNRDPEREQDLWGVYREGVMALQLAIKESKDRAWDEFLGSLERDRWGRPYKLVMEKLRPWAPPVAETLDPQFLGSVVEALFPREEHPTRTGPLLRLPRSDGVEVTVEDLVRAVRRVKARSTAPGPDGVPSRVLSLVLPHLGQRVARLFTACLREGTFPGIWKRGRLVLLRKAGRPEDEPSSYRPIVLLDEIGKLFERVIAERLVAHLSGVGPDLAPCQFGFRKERSTVDAVRRVRAIAEAATSRGGLAIAVSLDIVNAFNSLPYWAIEEGLVIHCVPGELRDIVSDYLRGRTVECVDREGVTRVWTVERGVPQGAALGPDLWLVGYNAALTVPLPDGVFGTCFADDTHILAVGRDWGRTSRNLEVGIAAVVSAIRRLGLEVAPRKTEAMAFCHPRGDKPPEGAVVRVDGVEVRIGTEMRYLGLLLDSHWSFEGHFNALAPRLGRTADALARLLPNLRGPSESVRRLYMGVVRSMALYGAPVWAADLMASGNSLVVLRRVERRLAIRVVMGYRTISYETSMVLAGVLPWRYQAQIEEGIYDLRRRLRGRNASDTNGGDLPDPSIEEARLQARRDAIWQWRLELLRTGAVGKRAVGAILPLLEKWMDRGHGALTFRTTQVLSGHGCFAEYLCRMGREPSPQCYHCGEGPDTAQHTLSECPAFAWERHFLQCEVGAVGGSSKPIQTKEEQQEERSRNTGKEGTTGVSLPVVRCVDILAPPKTANTTELSKTTGSEAPGPARERDSGSETEWRTTRRSLRLCKASSDAGASGRDTPRSDQGEDPPIPAARPIPRRRVINEDGDSDSDSSIISVETLPSRGDSRGSRGRGRPPTTGEYVRLAEAKERWAEAKKAELELHKELGAYDLTRPVPGPSKGSKPIPEVEDIMREVRHLTTVDLQAELIRYTDLIRRVARGSTNLKGTSVRQLRISTNYIEGLTTELAKRRDVGEDRTEETATEPPRTRASGALTLTAQAEENEQLKRQLRAAQEEQRKMAQDLAALRLEVERLKKSPAGGAPPPAERSLEPARKTRRRVLSSSESEREDVKRRMVAKTNSPPPELVSPAEAMDDPPASMETEEVRPVTEGTTGDPVPTLQREVRPEEASQARKPPSREPETVKSRGSEKGEAPATGLESVVAHLVRKVEELSAELRGRTKERATSKNAQLKVPPKPQPRAAPRRARTFAEAAGRAAATTVAPAARPTAAAPPGELWTTVLGRKAKKEARKAEQPNAKTGVGRHQAAKRTAQAAPKTNSAPKRVTAPRPPRMAAVTLTVAPGAETSYAQTLLRARQAVNLQEIGITDIKVRKAFTGGILIGVPGEEGRKKASALAEKLKETFDDGQVKVACPVKTGEMRLLGLDESITPKDVAEALAALGGCEASELKVGEIKHVANRMGTVWVRCPLTALKKVEEAGKVRVGWSSARVEILEARSMRCFKCLHKGHTAQQCPEKENRSGRCYACGAEGHKAASCTNKIRCPLCSDLGRPDTHRLGAAGCAPEPKKKKKTQAQPEERTKEQQTTQPEESTMEVVNESEK
ncbi:uncharacterized protein LOC143264206 [Megachile rotundata]|uniref:uncharacterized protein LOC143264206 n=1 Tax=Megachile rotundata TaxID=143995 RepID=UPI003FD5538D